MEHNIKQIINKSKIDKIYQNNLFSIKSICQELDIDIWKEYSNENKWILENLTTNDTKINKHFKYKIDYNKNYNYGEILRSGVEIINEKINKYKKSNNDFFIDIGSGTGKLLLHLSLISELKTFIGVEIIKERNLYSRYIKEKVEPIENKSIFLIEKDALSFDMSFANIAFINDFFFDDKLTENIINRLPEMCHIITTKNIKAKIYKETFKIDVSWINKGCYFNYYIK